MTSIGWWIRTGGIGGEGNGIPMEIIFFILIMLFSVIILRFYDSIRYPSTQAEEPEVCRKNPPEAFRQCVETHRNTTIEIKLHGRSFIQNPLWYCTISIPKAGMLIDEQEVVLIQPTVLKHKNVLRYTPEKEFVGTDRFHFVVYDGEFSQSAYVVIKVTDRRPSMSASRKETMSVWSNRKPCAWHKYEKALHEA